MEGNKLPAASVHNLVRLRRSLGLSQRGTARALGLGRNSVGRYESGDHGDVPRTVVLSLCWMAHAEGMEPMALGLEVDAAEA